MSLLQRIDVHQKAGLKHPAFRPIGVINSAVSEVIETDEDVRVPIVPDDVVKRPPATVGGQVIGKYADSEKWCGDQRTKYTVLKVEATSFVLALTVAFTLLLMSAMFPEELSLIGP